MKSPTAEVKEIITNFLKASPDTQFTNYEIKAEISKKTTQPMSDGVIAGALYTLSNDKQSGLISPTRGIYMYSPQSIQSKEILAATIYRGVHESIETLKSVISSIDILEIDEKDLPILKETKGMVEFLETFNEELMNTYMS